MGNAARTVIVAIGLLLVVFHSAFALDAGIITRAEHAIESYQAEMDAASQKLRAPAVSESDLADLRSTFERLRASGAERSAELQGPLADIQSQLQSLGPAPTDGRAEDATIVKTRDDLSATRDKLQGLKSQLDVLTLNAEQSAAEVSVLQRDEFFERIFDRNRSILNPSLWVDMWNGIGALSLAMSIFMKSWWRDVSPNASPWGLAAVPVIVVAFFAGYQIANRWLGRWMNRFTRTGNQLDDMTRLWLIVRSLLGSIVALLVLIGPIHLALEVSGYMTPRVLMIWMGLLLTVVYTLLYYRVALGISAPGAPERRIIDVDDRTALRFTILAAIIGAVGAFNTQLIRIADGLYLGFNYTVGHSAVSALVLLLLISSAILTLRSQPGFSEAGGRRLYFSWVANLMPFVWLIILVGFGSLLLGYLSLADYLAHQIIRTAMLVTVVFLFYHLLDAAVAESFDPHSSFGTFLRRMTGMSERSIERTGLIIRTSVDVFLIIAGVPTLLLLWTFTWVDFSGFVNTLKIGVQVGSITISPAVALAVLGTLIGGIVVTKLFNRWLNRRILPDTRINKGVQDSILKGATYTGYVLAAGFALAAAGINFSNIAIIAGALGVGIGLACSRLSTISCPASSFWQKGRSGLVTGCLCPQEKASYAASMYARPRLKRLTPVPSSCPIRCSSPSL